MNGGGVKVRYAEPHEDLTEFGWNLYRFGIKDANSNKDACIFCLKAKGVISYYLLPSRVLVKIKTLNLKFDDHGKSKYSAYLAKVESQE